MVDARVREQGAGLAHRLATEADLDAIQGLMERAIRTLIGCVLSPAEVEASFDLMGLDTQLIADRTYFVLEGSPDGRPRLVGCGGWSARATLFGGDHSPNRDAGMLDPARDAARIRAMYTDPDYARRGVGRRIIALCEAAAREAGFGRVELVSTLAGEPFYRACGYEVIERFTVSARGLDLPKTRMGKRI